MMSQIDRRQIIVGTAAATIVISMPSVAVVALATSKGRLIVDVDEMLRKLHAGAELLTQLDNDVITYWFRTISDAGLFSDEDVGPADAMALIKTGYVEQTELETDGEGVWFTGYAINDAGRERIEPTGMRLH